MCSPLLTWAVTNEAENCLLFLIITLRLLGTQDLCMLLKDPSIRHMFAFLRHGPTGVHHTREWSKVSPQWGNNLSVLTWRRGMHRRAELEGMFPLLWPCRGEVSYQLFTLCGCVALLGGQTELLPPYHGWDLPQSDVSFVSPDIPVYAVRGKKKKKKDTSHPSSPSVPTDETDPQFFKLLWLTANRRAFYQTLKTLTQALWLMVCWAS